MIIFLSIFFILQSPTKTENKYSAYLFAYFKGASLPLGEQVYFAVSKDGFHWTDLYTGLPILSSTISEKGLRDPFIMRSHDDSKFYLFGTDQKFYHTDKWPQALTNGSQNIIIWESSDLINWSEPRILKVAPKDAGCVWAPEAIYNDKTGEYVVFWSSTKKKERGRFHRVYYTTTKDFVNFGETKVWIELKNENGEMMSVIDASVIKDGDTYYRFMKNEANREHKQGMPYTGKYMIMEKSKDLFGDWEEIDTEVSQITYVEGPVVFKLHNEEKWVLFLDSFRDNGYFPLVSSDLSSGVFKKLNKNKYSLQSIMRHGSVISLTEEEYKTLVDKYNL